MSFGSRFTFLAVSIAIAFAPIVKAAKAQFQVNTYTTNRQVKASVAADAAGLFVVVWHSFGSFESSGNSIQGQRYAWNVRKLGGQFHVGTAAASPTPSVAMDQDGDFVVVWERSLVVGPGDASGLSIRGRRYASDGSAQGSEFQVNTYTTNNQRRASAAMEPDGDFVVVWESRGSYGTDTQFDSIQAQRYASDWSAQGAQFQVNSYTRGSQTFPSVAADADGDFVVVWRNDGQSLTNYSIQGQRYDSGGFPQGGEFQVETYTTGKQTTPSVAMDAAGNFVVAWSSPGSSGTDTSGTSIQGQRYASNGSPQGGEFQVNSGTLGNQQNASVAAAPNGDFVVAWDGLDWGDFEIHGQRFASNGTMEGAEFQVNTYTTNEQDNPSAAALADGGLVIAWESNGSAGTDTDSDSVQGRRYGVSTAPPVPAMSAGTKFALAAALLLLGTVYAQRFRS